MDFGDKRYFVLVCLCVAISTYTSYRGWLSFTGPYICLGLTSIIAISLFSFDLAIKRRVQNRQQFFGIFLVFLIPLSLSTMSNFNYLYTSFMQRNEAKAVYEEAYNEQLENLNKLTKEIKNDTELQNYESIELEIVSQLDLLKIQINDINNPGFGELARTHMNRIENLLGKESLTTLRIPSSTEQAQINKVFSEYQKLVLAALDNVSSSRVRDLRNFLATLNRANSDLVKKNAELAKESTSGDEYLKKVRLLVAELPELKAEASKFGLDIQQIEIHQDPENAKLGEIAYTLSSAFLGNRRPAVTYLTLAISLILDIFPLLVAVVMPSSTIGFSGQSNFSVKERKVSL